MMDENPALQWPMVRWNALRSIPPCAGKSPARRQGTPHRAPASRDWAGRVAQNVSFSPGLIGNTLAWPCPSALMYSAVVPFSCGVVP